MSQKKWDDAAELAVTKEEVDAIDTGRKQSKSLSSCFPTRGIRSLFTACTSNRSRDFVSEDDILALDKNRAQWFEHLFHKGVWLEAANLAATELEVARLEQAEEDSRLEWFKFYLHMGDAVNAKKYAVTAEERAQVKTLEAPAEDATPREMVDHYVRTRNFLKAHLLATGNERLNDIVDQAEREFKEANRVADLNTCVENGQWDAAERLAASQDERDRIHQAQDDFRRKQKDLHLRSNNFKIARKYAVRQESEDEILFKEEKYEEHKHKQLFLRELKNRNFGHLAELKYKPEHSTMIEQVLEDDRREYILYHMKRGEFDEASELCIDADEHKDLDEKREEYLERGRLEHQKYHILMGNYEKSLEFTLPHEQAALDEAFEDRRKSVMERYVRECKYPEARALAINRDELDQIAETYMAQVNYRRKLWLRFHTDRGEYDQADKLTVNDKERELLREKMNTIRREWVNYSVQNKQYSTALELCISDEEVEGLRQIIARDLG